MKKLFFLFVLSVIVLTTRATAQEVQINEDPGAGRVFQTWVRANRANPRIAGWRVQLMSTTDRQKIDEAKLRFRQLYSEVAADWVHEPPYYKLRVGAFRSRAEAMSFIASTLKDSYPGAYPAQDPNIHPRDFLSPNSPASAWSSFQYRKT